MQDMRLYDYLSLMDDGEELTVWDRDYDMEVYFHATKCPEDSWEKSEERLSRLLTITKISPRGVTVNLSEVIENHLDFLEKADLFYDCDMESIMDDIENIISGSVSEKWMEDFVNTLAITNVEFEVRFCRNGWENTLNPEDVLLINIKADCFDSAKKKARRMATEMGYSKKDGWRWNNTKRVIK